MILVSVTGKTNEFCRYVKAYDGEVRRTHSGMIEDYPPYSVTSEIVLLIRTNPPIRCIDLPPVVLRKVQTAMDAGGPA